jgi:hypothetical protein
MKSLMGKAYSGFQIVGLLLGIVLTFGGLGGYLWSNSIDGKPIADRVGYYYSVTPFMYALCIAGMVAGILLIVAALVIHYDDEPRAIPVYEKKESEKFFQNKFCPQCGLPTEQYYLRCPRCAYLLRKDCPGCKTRLPVDYAACPTCGYVFVEQNKEKAKEKVIPVKVKAIGRCPRCLKVVVEGQTDCQNCGWHVDLRDVGPV